MTEGDSPGPLTEINRIVRDNRVDDYPSANRELGMRPVEFGSGSAAWRWPEQPQAARNPFGLVQGGYLAVFADELLASAIASVLEDGEWAVTAETKLSYLRAVRPGALHGEARVLRRSRSLAFLEATILDADERTLVRAASTWAISREG